MKSGAELIDLSHIIEHGLITYKGLPAPVICDFLSREDSRKLYDEGTQFQIGKIEMVANTGTYLDCPFHRYEFGKDLSEILLERVVDIDGTIVHADYRKSLAITPESFKGKVLKDRAVLIHTGWDVHWNSEFYYDGHPFLTKDAAEFLKESGATLVGIDSHNIDDTSKRSRPAHTILLGAEILIVEHLCNLAKISNHEFTFSAVPPKFKGVGTFPVRAMAKLKR